MRDEPTTGDRALAAPSIMPWAWDELVHTWQGLDVPEGWRAEIIEESLVMTAPPRHSHNLIVDLVHRELVAAIPQEWAIFQTAGVSVRSKCFVHPGSRCRAPRAGSIAGTV